MELTQVGIVNIKYVLDGYFGIHMSDTKIKELVQDDEELIDEANTGGITDTCMRDTLIHILTKKYELPDWPTYGHSQEYQNEFYEKLDAIKYKFL